jgi:hypothetical protein
VLRVRGGVPPLVTPEQFTAILVAMAGLITAVATLAGAVHGYHKQVNSRMDELLRLTASSSHAAGLAEQAKPELVDQP